MDLKFRTCTQTSWRRCGVTLRRIRRNQLRLGMYIHTLEGSWFKHPFWKRGFLLERETDLAAVLSSQIETLLIDISKGADLAKAKAKATLGSAAPEAFDEAWTQDERTAAAVEVVNRSKEVMRQVLDTARLGQAIESTAVTSVVEDVASCIEHNQPALLKILRLKSKDEYTYLHSVAVCALMISLARQLGLDRRTTKDLGTAGLLHDIGKVVLPVDVLNKPGRLTDEEFALVKTHSLEGYRLLSDLDNIPEAALDVCQHHHEKIDGSGYPHGLCAEQITLAARMGAICDVYDAVTSDRPYKDAWAPLEAITRMRQWNGHFDPKILFAFMVSIGVFPVGTLVQLQNERIGVIIEGGRHATKPKVLTFYSTRKRKFTRSELVIAGGKRSSDAIVCEADPAEWGISLARIDHLVRLGARWV
ncbi:HD-GYP domain-containing protein [Novosphingobium sp. RD2P27]|uniref:HD-GYP domain-containing protein n=1 Tax=Novosphingobium kalidii TaxID=3230299 RepID=A0ABV2D3W9_9SPHN